MGWMNLEITCIAGERLVAVHERMSLTDCDAANDHSIAFGNSDLPALPLQPIERKEIGTAVDPQADVPRHRTLRGQRN
jgi:hypothetical protein